ncbi:unnamed protein product [Closterium sp. Yama58-4]|nr:unnamed protein product [Closterium sp. Yama58-4]
MISLEDVLSAAEKESSDLVFSPDDAYDANDDTVDSLADDPFASRSPIPTDPNAPAAQLFPSADDMEKVLSAYNSAPAAVSEIGVDDLKAALEGNADAVPVLIDVRAPEDYKRGHIPRAVSVSMGDVVAYAADAGSGPLAFVCYAGNTSKRAAMQVAVALDLPSESVLNVTGGTAAWVNAGYPLEQ